MNSLLEIETNIIHLTQKRQEAQRNHNEFLQKNECELEEMRRQKAMLLKGIDANRIKSAENLLRIYGLDNERNFNVRCINEAINDIAQGSSKLQKEYFGIKNYEGWTHQECDLPYGFDPKHGSIVFSVGLSNPKHNLTDEETECCLYYLNLLLDKDSRIAIRGNQNK